MKKSNIIKFGSMALLAGALCLNSSPQKKEGPEYRNIDTQEKTSERDLRLKNSFDYSWIKEVLVNPNERPNDSVGKNYSEMSRQEKVKEIDSAFALDKTDTLTYDSIDNKWVCGDFALQTCINFRGYPGMEAERGNYDTLYNPENNGRFNLPLFPAITGVNDTADHVINAILVGDNPYNFHHWLFIEPQNDKKVKPGDWDMSKEYPVEICYNHNFHTWGGAYYDYTMLKFEFEKDSVYTSSYRDSLIITDKNPGKYKQPLKQGTRTNNKKEDIYFDVYPNPVKNTLKGEYDKSTIKNPYINLYDISGKKELERKIDNRGEFILNMGRFDKGEYILKLRGSENSLTKKIINR